MAVAPAPVRADGYTGTISGSDHRFIGGLQDITGKWSGNVTFESSTIALNAFSSVSGTVTWSESGTELGGGGVCQISIPSATAPIGAATAPNTVSGSVQLFLGSPLQYQIALTTNAQIATGTETCPSGGIPAYYELPTPLQTRPRETANADQSLTGTYQYTAGYDTVTYQWHLTPVGGLHADPGGPYGVVRGGRLRLDGSRSTPQNKIRSYRWSFNQPSSTCPPGARPRAGHKTGVHPSVVMLCSMRVTLTVSDGVHHASASVAIRVHPRNWTTRVRQLRYSHGGGGITWSGPDDRGYVAGINESACPHANVHTQTVVCPLFSLHRTWNRYGYKLAQVHRRPGPNCRRL